MAFLEISFNAKRPLILGRGGFGTQLNDWLLDEGWGSADFLDDNAPMPWAVCAITRTRPSCTRAALPLWRWAITSCVLSCCKS